MKYWKKPDIVEAITFDELVEHGKKTGCHIVDDYPWSFDYDGIHVTHENNNCYLVGGDTMTRNDLLVTDSEGVVRVYAKWIFDTLFERHITEKDLI